MASRSHVDVNERRLRPIYDCLDNGNNKKAIQEADKVLKKQRDLQCAKVLKALALLRLGRHDDSTAILQEVHTQHPTDEPTLQAMAICYREVHKLELIANMYENAHKARPDNEEILSALFMSYVRLGDYKKQQQTAMVLHKLRPQKNPYYFWAVMSIVMQAHSCQDKKLAKTMFLPLAERMTQKYFKEEKIEAEAEVQLYLIILELLEKWEAALDLIQGPLGEKIVSEYNYQKIKAAELYSKLEKWHKANAIYKDLLKSNPDHWRYWQEYLKSMLNLSAAGWTPDNDSQEQMEDIDYTEEQGLKFIQKCLQDTENPRTPRAPYLAKLELIRLLRENGSDKLHLLEEPLQLLEEYFDIYGHKFCCFADLKLFVDLLDDKEQIKLIENLSEKIHFIKDVNPIVDAQDTKELQRHVTLLQLSRYLNMHGSLSIEGKITLSIEEKITLSKELIHRHKNSLDLGKELLSTDMQYADNYMLLAVALLVDVWQETGDNKVAWQIIVQLEKGVRASTSSYQFKFLLIRMYCTMGAFGPCLSLYDGMEIKHVMNDTLGHIVSNHVTRLGHFMAACAMYGSMLRFFTVNHKETTEYLIASYKYGSFSKIQEFVRFREKLQNSLQYASATAERLLLDLVLETNSHTATEQMVSYMEIDPEKDKTVFDELCDNRDFAVMTVWDPPERYSMEQFQEKSFEEEKAWLRIRNLTLRLLAASVMLGRQPESDTHANNGVTTNDKTPMHEVVQNLQQQLSNHFKHCKSLKIQEQNLIHGPFRTRLGTYMNSHHGQMFVHMVDNVTYTHMLQEGGVDKVDNEKEEAMRMSVPSLAEEMVLRHKGSLFVTENDRKSLNPSVLENLVLVAESISHATVLAGVCHKMLKPMKLSRTRKGKKKKDNAPPMPSTFENFNTLVNGLEKAAHNLHSAMFQLDPLFLAVDLGSLNLSESLLDTEEDAQIEKEVWDSVQRSYQHSVREVTEFLHNKMQYLNSLLL
ncbi:hypothetical protein ScPMuIL_006724 [Solemya velum]